jgi:L-rhamnose-H+ transport protein
MQQAIAFGALLAIVSGLMNGLFTLPMRFLGRWSWENVWSVFIVTSCLLLPSLIVFFISPAAFSVLAAAPGHAVLIAVGSGCAWGFGAVMFGQSVSAIGIALANTFVLAISSALGSLLPMLLLAPEKLSQRPGHMILLGLGIEIVGIALCGRAGMLREAGQKTASLRQRGDLVGVRRPLATALLLAGGAGLLSAVFNIGFVLATPISTYAQGRGLSVFMGNNLIWVLMLGGGAVSNLGFCAFLLRRHHSMAKFAQPGSRRLYGLGLLMGILWGGSIFVYGAAAPRMGILGPSIGWPLSLATGLLVANITGLLLGEWEGAPHPALRWMFSGIGVLVAAIVVLSKAN